MRVPSTIRVLSIEGMRWLFHIAEEGAVLSGAYRLPSLRREKFIHASFKDQVEDSARLHFPEGARLSVLQIDPRRLEAEVKFEASPRGPMPHIYGSIDADAIRAVRTLGEIDDAPDEITGTK